ncbi:MAG: hypothetical protein JNK82_01835 [Myxococcaceae bacterium]|nr:hypothetical protein [Myxococcaceae bacterium]
MVKTPEEAMGWIRRHRIALQAAKVEGVPSLAHEIVQGPIKGSWWGHPMGKVIFALATHVTGSGEVLALKLIEGKTTYVHRALWPALVRVLLDPGWRGPRVAALRDGAKRLFAEVEREGEVRDADAKAVKALEDGVLALVVSHHTARGHHEKVLTSWSRWAKTAGVKGEGTFDAALLELRAAAHGAEIL